VAFDGAPDVYGRWGYVVAALGTAVSATTVAWGVFQILASAFADRAREVDVHKIAGQPSLPEVDGAALDESRPHARPSVPAARLHARSSRRSRSEVE
jgi:hypothetical protein